MKLKVDTPKSSQAISNVIHKTTDISKKAIATVQSGARALSEKSKNESYLRKLKKYNPLFLDTYNSDSFNIPNMIMIVDDAVRRGIDVCEGSIGWISKEAGMEVMYLYDEAVESSGIQFIPTVVCDAVYYVDSFDRNKYIRTDCIFSKAHEERLAELKHIAYSLGAKSCSIEISESSVEVQLDKKKVDLKENIRIKGSFNSSESQEQSLSYKGKNQRSGQIRIEFEGNDTPKQPQLKWFIHDENIKNLIEMRCERNNTVKSESLELSGASSATMSQKTAFAIDTTISKMGVKGGIGMETQATKENLSKLIFNIEF